MSQTKYNLYSNNFESFCIMRVVKMIRRVEPRLFGFEQVMFYIE